MNIKTWAERCEEHPDHNGIVTNRMIQARMQEEADDLRDEVERLEKICYDQLAELTKMRAVQQMNKRIEALRARAIAAILDTITTLMEKNGVMEDE
jgi:hypothetical protein